jgi:hypothetical protein
MGFAAGNPCVLAANAANSIATIVRVTATA